MKSELLVRKGIHPGFVLERELKKSQRVSIDTDFFTGEHQETIDFDMLFMS